MTFDDKDVSLIELYAAHRCVNRSLQHANFKKKCKVKCHTSLFMIELRVLVLEINPKDL